MAPKNIIDVVREKQGHFKENKVLAGQNMAMAIAALREGIKSNAWQYYMTQFVDRNPDGTINREQLARLMATDDTLGDPVLDRQRAYLVANAVCGVSTTDFFDFGVESIDYGLADCERAVFDCETGVAQAPTSRTARKPPKKKPGKKYKKPGA